MGTQKRERQKANRQQRLIEEARAERVGTVKRTVLRWGIGGVAALGAIVLIAWIGGAFDSDEDTTSDLPSDNPTIVTDPPTDVTNPPAETYSGGTTPADDSTGKPSAQLPAEAPTELVITDIVEGTGEGAQNGDTVLVNYVGVRSANGAEFDTSYGAAPYPVVLGSGAVIDGWEQGLLGVKTGGRRQLDIPSELAYGDLGSGALIAPGDAITFVIDVVSITPAGE